MEKCLIVAIADNNGIGVKGQLPWHIAEDLKYFKKVTHGYPVIMGRTTYFSLPFRPLKGRKNIVLNLGGDPIPEVTCVYSFEEAYAAAEIDPQAAVAEYYAKLGLTEEAHLQRLREAQTRYEKRKLLRDVIAVNIRFYARAGAAFVSDLFSALHWRIRTARAKKRK